MKLWSLAVGLIILAVTGVAAFQMGSWRAEVKVSMIYNLDDMSALIAQKQSGSDETKRLIKPLRDRIVWRYEMLKSIYEQSLWRFPLSLDKEINLGFRHMEKQIHEFDSAQAATTK